MNASVTGSSEQRMKLQYGVAQADQCRDFAIGPHRERIWARLREIDTHMVRLFLFDKGAPDHLKEWEVFAAYVEAVLNVGAKPMMTFAKFQPPFDDPWSVRAFAERSADVVRRCIDQWGGEAVRDWYWCVWNEPNNGWISDGGLPFEQYRRIYEEVAQAVLKQLDPHLDGRKPLIGGPAVEGFPNFWWDWPWRFVNEIDNALIGFVDWHRYADWRDAGEHGAPQDESTYRALIASQALDYQFRSRAIGRQVRGREILNICGELNCHSHYTAPFTSPPCSISCAGRPTPKCFGSERRPVEAMECWTSTASPSRLSTRRSYAPNMFNTGTQSRSRRGIEKIVRSTLSSPAGAGDG
jgi:hypothetical protein